MRPTRANPSARRCHASGTLCRKHVIAERTRNLGPEHASASGSMAPGFTLVEVLVTIAFSAILLPTIMRAISLTLSASDYARQQAVAASLAHGKLSELVAVGGVQRAVLSGDFGEDWPGYRWEAGLYPWDGVNLLQLDVTVYWRQASGVERGVTETTLVYNYTPLSMSGGIGGTTP